MIPLVLTKILVAHAAMMQVSGEGEANRQKMVITAKALMMGTEWEQKICPDYLWRKVREDHPVILNPIKQKHNEDRRVDWLTYKNVNDWTDRSKAYLVELSTVKNEPGLISELLVCFYFLTFQFTFSNTRFLQMGFGLRSLSSIPTALISF